MDDATDAGSSSDDWSYRGSPSQPKMLLAPMVRVNSLAFRTLCSEFGADMLYSEEIVARCLVQSKRSNNDALGTIDFTALDNGPAQPGGRVCFRTRPGEQVVLQLGTACGTEALQAASCMWKVPAACHRVQQPHAFQACT